MVEEIAAPVAKSAVEYLDWYLSLPTNMLMQQERNTIYHMYQLNAAARLLKDAGCKLGEEMEKKVMAYNGILQRIYYGQMDTEVGVTDTNHEDTDEEEEDYTSSDIGQ